MSTPAATEPNFRREPRDYHHGKSPASWVGAIGVLVAAIIGAAGFLTMSIPLIITCFVLAALAGIVTLVLRGLGYGQADVDPAKGQLEADQQS